MKSIDLPLAISLRSKFDQALEKVGARVSFLSRKDSSPRKVWAFVDESIVHSETETFFMVGMTLVEDLSFIEERLNVLLSNLLSDPFLTGDRTKLEKKGLHWADMSEDTRKQVVKFIAELPLRSFVAYSRSPKSASISFLGLYQPLFKELLRGRYRGLDGADLEIIFEEHPQLKPGNMQGLGTSLYESLQENDARRPRKNPKIRVGLKNTDICVALIDNLLGAFGQFGLSESIRGNRTTPVAVSRFETIRHQFRLIIEYNETEAAPVFFTSRAGFQPWAVSDKMTQSNKAGLLDLS